jgi:glycosyltransferase involved in cell wall biosynthesis
MIPLIVDLETEWRGGQNQALLLLRGLYERGHPAELVAAKGSSLAHRALKANICVHHVSRGTLRLPAAAKIRSTLRDGRIDLVHANEAHAATAAWLAGVHKKVPFVISRRVGYPLGKSWIAQARYKAASCIIANSQWVADQAVASGAPQEKLRVVYEGALIPERTSPAQRRTARHRWGVTDDSPLLGCVGVLLPDKGQEWLIRALVELRKEFPGARLLLAGDGPMRGELKALAKTLHLGNAVIFAGFVKDVENVYAALDVFLLPSFFEALNNSLLAAMAHGIPSIAFRRGALAEIIEDGRSGLIVSGPQVAEICEAAARILRDRDFARELAEAGRTRVAENFSADRMVERTEAVYNEVLQFRSAL